MMWSGMLRPLHKMKPSAFRTNILIAVCSVGLVIFIRYGVLWYMAQGEIERQDKVVSPVVVCSASLRATETTKLCLEHRYDKKNPFAHETIGSNRRQNFFVDDSHKLIYCSVPKTGSTSLARYLWDLTVPEQNETYIRALTFFKAKTGIRMLRDLPDTEKRKVLRDYFKFMVVRHPLDRLVSAWTNTFIKPNLSKVVKGKVKDIVTEYMKKLDPNRQEDFNNTIETLTFEQFVDLVAEKYHEGFQLTQWVSYFEMCLPCHVHYDRVLRIETLSRDMSTMDEYLHSLDPAASAPSIQHNNEKRPINSLQKMATLSIAYQNISALTMKRLKAIYKHDLTLFGYGWENGTASCSLTDEKCC